MSNNDIQPVTNRGQTAPEVPLDEDKGMYNEKGYNDDDLQVVPALAEEDPQQATNAQLELGTTDAEFARLEAGLDDLTFDRTVKIVQELVEMHKDDPNFSITVLEEMVNFLNDQNVMEHPDKYPEIVRAMKLEALLATENSPYAEVRANVDPTDDPDMPVSTIRMWFIGICFCCIGCFIDNLFAFRYPSISLGVNVAQLVAYPLGKFFARVLPDKRFNLFGHEMSLNPGPFNRKEHMVISIMANVSFNAPYTFYIIPVQAMPQYFNMSFAYNRGYQLCISLAVNLFGYGLAGILRRFLVYPSVAIWPTTFSTMALIKAFHSGTNEPVPGPFGRIYRASREKIFLVATAGMFCYFLFPGYIFQALSTFSWMCWIAPKNINLTAVTGTSGGVGLNPWPTFDWNLFSSVGGSGLYLPTFTVVNQICGSIFSAFIILAIWYTNTWNTGYLPINSNGTFDNTASNFNVTRVLDPKGNFNQERFEAYSQPWFSAGYIVYNIFGFASYTASLAYVFLFYWGSIKRGMKGVYKSFIRHSSLEELEEDVHYRHMKAYKEAPEWWFLVLLILPIGFGIAAVQGWPTGAPVAALFYGLILPIIFVIPLGIVQAVTGVAVALNILADVIGGVINAGKPNGLIYFKVWAYLSSWQAIGFSNDLKLAHYYKIPPRVTFSAQIVSTIIFSIVSSLSYNFIMGLKNVCTPDASFKFTCPYQTSFYTATIFWGVLSPKKLFGPGQRYNMMLLGFPLGLALALIYWSLRRAFPNSRIVRNFHPVMFAMGPVTFAAPYNLAFNLGNLYVNLISYQWLRKKYLSFWAKWNYVISAAFSCGIALCGLFIFFALELPKNGTLGIEWWGNTVVTTGCEGQGGCPRLEVPDVGYFGPAPGQY